MKRLTRSRCDLIDESMTYGFDFPPPPRQPVGANFSQGSAGMICPKCKSWVPEGDLACKVCAAQRSREAFIEHQRQFMPLVFAGSLALHIRRGKIAGAGSQLHIELFGDATHTYCGVPTQGMKLSYLIFQGELRAPQDTCVQCAALFERLLNEELDAIPVDTPEETQNG
jgi:hypothetical protein